MLSQNYYHTLDRIAHMTVGDKIWFVDFYEDEKKIIPGVITRVSPQVYDPLEPTIQICWGFGWREYAWVSAMRVFKDFDSAVNYHYIPEDSHINDITAYLLEQGFQQTGADYHSEDEYKLIIISPYQPDHEVDIEISISVKSHYRRPYFQGRFRSVTTQSIKNILGIIETIGEMHSNDRNNQETPEK